MAPQALVAEVAMIWSPTLSTTKAPYSEGHTSAQACMSSVQTPDRSLKVNTMSSAQKPKITCRCGGFRTRPHVKCGVPTGIHESSTCSRQTLLERSKSELGRGCWSREQQAVESSETSSAYTSRANEGIASSTPPLALCKTLCLAPVLNAWRNEMIVASPNKAGHTAPESEFCNIICDRVSRGSVLEPALLMRFRTHCCTMVVHRMSG